MLDHALIYLFVFFLVGSFAGLLSGLIGIGGGIVLVPAYVFLFKQAHFPVQSIMQLAAGTSFAVMLILAPRSLYAHSRYKLEFWSIVKLLLPGVIVGAILGPIIAHHLHSIILQAAFAVIVLVVALRLFFTKEVQHKAKQLKLSSTYLVGFAIGILSSMLGIGGSVFVIPYLTYQGVDMRRCVLVSISVSLMVAIFGVSSYIISGLQHASLPEYTLGYVFWPGALAAALGSIFFSPLGVFFSHRLPVPALRKIFASFLLVVALHMFMHT